MSFIDELRKKARQRVSLSSRVFDQINPLDSGRSFKTRTPTQNDSIATQARDIFDSNSQRDRTRRLQQQRQAGLDVNANSPTVKNYRDQQIAMGNKRPMENLGAQVAGNTARFVNTANYAARAVADTISGDLDRQRRTRERFGRPDSGLLGTGTIYNSPEEMTNLGSAEIAKRVALNTVGTASEIVPFGRVSRPVMVGNRLVGNSLRAGGKTIATTSRGGSLLNKARLAERGISGLKVRAGFNAGIDATTGAGESVARQYAQTGNVDPLSVLTDTLASTALGQAQLVPAYARGAYNNSPTVKRGVDSTVNNVQKLEKNRLADTTTSNREMTELRRDTTQEKIFLSQSQGRSTTTLKQQLARDNRAVLRAKALEKIAILNRDTQIGNSLKVTNDTPKPSVAPKPKVIAKTELGENTDLNKGLKEVSDIRKQYNNDAEFYDKVILNNQEAEGDIGKLSRSIARNVEGKGYDITEELDYQLAPEPTLEAALAEGRAINLTDSRQQLSKTIRDLEKSTGQKGLFKQVSEQMKDMSEQEQVDYMGKAIKQMRDDGVLAADFINKQNGYNPTQPAQTQPKPVVKLQTEAPVKQPQTTVKALDPETQALTATQSLPPALPPRPPVNATGQPLLGMGKQKATRFADKTIPESKFVSPEIQEITKKNAPLYTPENEGIRFNQAITKYEKLGKDKFENQLYEQLNAKKGSISSSTVAESQTLAAKLDAEGNYAKASEIYDKISEHLTAAGQTIQAAAIMSRRSPDGLRRHALQTIQKSGIKITKIMQDDLGELTQAVRKAQTSTDKQRATYAIGEYVKKQVPDNWWNKSVNMWRAGLLTSPVTTGGNLLANSAETALRKGIINPTATLADMIMGTVTGKRTMTLAKAGSATRGLGVGAKSLPEYLKTGFEAGDTSLKPKYENSGTINYGSGPLGKTLGAYVNGVYRLMGVADAPFRKAAEFEVLSSIAKAEAINKGLKGQARTEFVKQFIANPPKEAVQRVADEGTRATFQNDTLLNDVAQGLKSKLEQRSAPARAVSDFVIPFVRTPSAIATRMIERTPIGVAKEVVNQIVNVRSGKAFDQRAMSQAIGNGAFGSLAIGAGIALANTGAMTFGFPSEGSERKLWELEGKQPYSVKVGDRWLSLNYLQPFGTLLAIGGQAGQDIKDGDSSGEAITKALATAGQSIQDQSFLKGINGVLTAISDPDRSARRYMEQTVSSVVPNFIRAGARSLDSVQREATNVTESLMSAIPGLRQNVPVKKDVFGRDLAAKDNFLNQFVNPLRPSKVKTDPMTEELRRLKDSGLATFPTESNKNVFGKETPLGRDELSKLNTSVAQSVAKQWESAMKSDDYNLLNDEDKKKTLDAIKKDYSAVAKAQWASDNGFGAVYKPNLSSKQKAIAQGDSPDYVYDGLPSNLNKTAKRLLTEEQTDEWKKTSNADDEVNTALSSWLGKDIQAPPINNETARLWADYEKKKLEGSIGKLEDESVRKSILVSAYNSQLNEDERDLYSLSKERLEDVYDRGLINDQNIDNALNVERQLFDAGLIAKETLARKLGLDAGGYKTGKGRGGKSVIDSTAFKVNKITSDSYRNLDRLLAGTRSSASVEPRQVATRKAVLKQIRVRA